MLRVLCVTAIAIATTVLLRPAHAYEAPWCAVIGKGEDSVYWDCQYRSFEDCYPHIVAGDRGFCNENPAYRGVEPRRHSAPRKRVRRY